jgi:hypothetical protein
MRIKSQDNENNLLQYKTLHDNEIIPATDHFHLIKQPAPALAGAGCLITFPIFFSNISQ